MSEHPPRLSESDIEAREALEGVGTPAESEKIPEVISSVEIAAAETNQLAQDAVAVEAVRSRLSHIAAAATPASRKPSTTSKRVSKKAPGTKKTLATTPPVPPVAPVNKVFSARDELRYILSSERAEKKERLAEHKEKLAEYKKNLLKQQEALAQSRIEIEKVLKKDPDKPKAEVLGILGSDEYKEYFPPENKALAEEFLDRYYAARKKVLDLHKRIPDEKELAKYLTGVDFPDTSKFAVRTGPMSLEIFADAADVQKAFEHNKGRKQSPVDGFAGTTPDGVNYSFISKGSVDMMTTVAHEQQHQTNKIFKETYRRTADQTELDSLELTYDAESDPEKKKELLRKSFTISRKAAYDRLKDELFAIVADSSSFDSTENLFKSGSVHEFYDYLKPIREKNPGDPVWKEVSDKMLVEEYSQVMHNAVEIVKDLQRDYSPAEVIAMLTEVPLEHWTKRTARIYQEKLGNPEIKEGNILKVRAESLEKERTEAERLKAEEDEAKRLARKARRLDWNEMDLLEKAETVFGMTVANGGAGLGVAAVGGAAGWAVSAGVLDAVGAGSALGPSTILTTGLYAGAGAFIALCAHAFMLEYFAYNIVTEGWKEIQKFTGGVLGGGGSHAPTKKPKPAAKTHAPAGGGHDH